MLTDGQLLHHLSADPFHAQEGQHDDAAPILDMLSQLFPSADAPPSTVWGPWSPPARATFTRQSLRPRS